MTFLGPDPLQQQVERLLKSLSQGKPPRDIEVTQVDIKEEPDRRGGDGSVLQGHPQNEKAARYLAEEMACMANTPGGGAIVLGISDDGNRIGTLLDPEWLRERIWQLTQSKLTVTVRPADLHGTRILVLTTDYAIEPIYYGNKLKWRVNRSCVEIDPNSWHAAHRRRVGYDWSAQPSGHTLKDVTPLSVDIARQYLTRSSDATGLAGAPVDDMIRRLNLVGGDGKLTHAGSLLFVATPGDGLDYIRRPVPGGGSTYRELGASRPLLEQIFKVEGAFAAANRTIHILRGLVNHQILAVPFNSFREALINGVTHRDWLNPNPTTVEHIGDQITVTSPGGFIGGITPDNIITHPAVPRYRSLSEAMSSLGLAERQGYGMDLMVSEMLALGRPRPEISEIGGPYVRIGLFGGDPDPKMIDVIYSLDPEEASQDVDLLLILDHLTNHGWIDERTASPALQRPTAETRAALERVQRVTADSQPFIVPVAGAPPDQSPGYRLGNPIRRKLRHRSQSLFTTRGREALILDWARGRGRASSTEVSDLTGLSVPYAGKLLTEMADRGFLVGSRPEKMGRGYHYLPADIRKSSPGR
jgi:ATP-dependent DNA helicase RecG